MRFYSIEPWTRKYVKGYGFLSFARSISNKYAKQLLVTVTIKVAHKAKKQQENKIVDAVAMSYDDEIVKPVEEIIIPPEKREEILNELRGVL